jgi:mono/diheme cytochrome c family protein
MRNIIIAAIIALLGAAWYFTLEKPSNQTAQNTPSIIVPELSAAAQTGETYFNAKCADCHGINGAGTQKGPTFMHKVYQSGHHADESFQRAAKLGTLAHHWNFGDMPPVTGVTRAEVAKIVIYIREIQAANGL